MTSERNPDAKRDSVEVSEDQWFVDLLLRARNGDRDAVDELMRVGRRFMLLIANDQLESTLRVKSAASDVVQESLIVVQLKLARFDGQNVHQFLGWLRGIVSNELREVSHRFRSTTKRNIAKEKSIDDGSPRARALQEDLSIPALAVGIEEESELLQRALTNLSDEHRKVIRLRNWDEFSFEAIGAEMNRTSDAARKLWSRALKRLEEEYEKIQQRSGDADGR